MLLSGRETKAIRTGKASLDGSHVVIRGGEAYLVGAHIAPYQPANTPEDYEPDRTRKLLLHKKELAKLERETDNAGLTIVPIRCYNSGRKLKLEIALARGKKKTDKRETIKKRESKRSIDRILKNQ